MFPAFSLPFLPITMSREPWNKDRQVGARLALTQAEIGQIRRHLVTQNSAHDLCLFMTAIDTMLRASDVLRLRVRNVALPNGEIRQTFLWKQKKTDKGVKPVLTPKTRKALKHWIKQSDKRFNDYLFTREKPRTAKPISIGFYRTLIKAWVRAIGLSPHDYSAHSLRRSKAVYMYENDETVEIIGRLLGHASPASTVQYLGIDVAKAHSRALANDIFARTKLHNPKQNSTFSMSEIDQLSDQIWEKLAPKLAEFLDENTKKGR